MNKNGIRIVCDFWIVLQNRIRLLYKAFWSTQLPCVVSGENDTIEFKCGRDDFDTSQQTSKYVTSILVITSQILSRLCPKGLVASQSSLWKGFIVADSTARSAMFVSRS